MKKSMLATVVASFVSGGVLAQSWCGHDHGHEEFNHFSPLAKMPQIEIQAALASGQTSVHEVLLFVQPTYFEEYGEYHATRRILAMFERLNNVYESQGISARIKLLNIERTVNVDDDLPFATVVEDGAVTLLGASDTLFQKAFNPGEIEYEQKHKWQADHVGYMREQRDSDGAILGLAITGGGGFRG